MPLLLRDTAARERQGVGGSFRRPEVRDLESKSISKVASGRTVLDRSGHHEFGDGR